jgi:AraC-like DNA-binding protein
MKQSQGPLPWLQLFQDPRLSRAVSTIFERPGHPFTLEELAAVSGMSRSAFAEHFMAAFDQSPMEFLKRVRLYRAARLLEVTNLPIKAVAKSVGYESRSYFSRAFRALHGRDPSEYRAKRFLMATSATGGSSE